MRSAVWFAAALGVAGAAAVRASQDSDALRSRAAVQIYNLDHQEAIATFQQAIAADPQDVAAFRGLAAGLWLSLTFRRGNMTIDEYLDRFLKVTGPNTTPPPEDAKAFADALNQAIAIARRRIAENPRDADAHYQLGAAVGLRASYTATVEGSLRGAFRTAREAYKEHEKVLELDPRRKDAELIVGTYRYVVSTLSMPLRWMAYLVGFGGGRERGLRMVEEAAGYPGDNQDDARLALILLYNREKRYDDALRQLESLRERYPLNRLVWLEIGSTNLRAGRPAEAERVLNEGLARFATDHRPRMFGEDALWLYKRGAARAALGRRAEAEADLRHALAAEGRQWVYGRTHLELGKLALKAGNHAAARQELQAAIPLSESENDRGTVDEARRLLR